MAVLIEGVSVVIHKAKALQNQQAMDALSSVESRLHPMAICADANLLRVGFVDLAEANAFISALEKGGLRFKTEVSGEDVAQDLMLVTQFGEMEVTCPWLTVAFTKLKDGTLITLASLTGDETKNVAFPKHWTLGDSILQRYYDMRLAYMEEHYDQVGEELMHDIFQPKDSSHSDQKTVRLMKLKVAPAKEDALQ
ncbi:MAG: hypothetical protein ACP5D0_02555 [Hydrogenovibrio sp.]